MRVPLNRGHLKIPMKKQESCGRQHFWRLLLGHGPRAGMDAGEDADMEEPRGPESLYMSTLYIYIYIYIYIHIYMYI